MNGSVSWLIFDELDSGRGQFDSYYERLESVVPTPDTEILELSEDNLEEWDSTRIQELMKTKGWKRAFVRTMQKAAPGSIHRGSVIDENTESEINRTLRSLFTQTRISEWQHGGRIAIRELLDTRFCLGKKHYTCHPEIRYIIEGGEILCKIPENVSVNCPMQYEYTEETVRKAEAPDDLAEKVADEFDKSTWAVDFVMDTDGDWYCLEMNLNGVRWNEDSDSWVNMCGYGSKIHMSPEIIHGSILREFKRDIY